MAVEKLNLKATSEDPRFAELKKLYPELFSDGNLNIEVLKEACGEASEESDYYGLYWPGKQEAKHLAKKDAEGTLEPVIGDGINEDKTNNIYIEGDNLEVLRCLRTSYRGRVKMIYIDPPYNTGNDFIYPDDYKEPVEDFLRFTGQMDDKGHPLVANTKDNGRFHRNWLNMMYPRLKIAQELLSEDGVIFVSIDEHEFGNLRLICDEIFGEYNYFGDLIWESTTQPINAGKAKFGVQKKTEVILMYAKDKGKKNIFNLKCQDGEFNYPHQGKFGKCRFEVIEKSDAGGYKRDTMKFEILGQEPRPGKRWQIGEDTARELEAAEKIEIVDGIVKKAVYPEDEADKIKCEPFWTLFTAKQYGTAEKGKQELTDTLGVSVGFDTVKPLELMEKFISYMDKDAIVLDFFSGSATTAHAVMKINSEEENSNRKFIMVQLPEKCKEDSDAIKAGYKNICEIGKQRIRKAGELILSEQPELKDTLDVGFKVYRLTKSNFSVFQNIHGTDQDALDLFTSQAAEEPLTEGWKDRKDCILTELLLRDGLALDSKKTKAESYKDNEVWKFVDVGNDNRTIYVCLDDKIAPSTAKNLALEDGEKFVCLDSAVGDQLKVQLADKGRIETI